MSWLMSANKICWSSNTQYLWLWNDLEIVFADGISRHEVIGQALLQHDWCPYKGKNTDTRGEHHVMIWAKDEAMQLQANNI